MPIPFTFTTEEWTIHERDLTLVKYKFVAEVDGRRRKYGFIFIKGEQEEAAQAEATRMFQAFLAGGRIPHETAEMQEYIRL